MRGGGFWEEELEGKWKGEIEIFVGIVEAEFLRISRFIKDFDYTGISKWKKEKEKRLKVLKYSRRRMSQFLQNKIYPFSI